MKNKLFLLFFVTVFGLTSCDNQQMTSNTNNNDIENAIDIKQEIEKFNDFMKKYDESSQKFKVTTEKFSKVIGKNGTTIFINSDDLMTVNGQPLGKTIEIELKEIHNKEQLLKANVPTVSDGKLLVSGGAYYINMLSDTNQLKIKEGKSLKVIFPKISDEEMSVFNGQCDSIGQINWEKTEQKFSFKKKRDSFSQEKTYEVEIISWHTDTIRTEGKLKNMTTGEINQAKKDMIWEEKVYSAVDITRFGWINCDYFYQEENKTDIDLLVSENNVKYNYIKVYLIFKNINSLLSQNIYFNNKSEKINNIPIGINVNFLAVAYQDHKIYATYKENIIINKNHLEKISLVEHSEQNFDAIFKSVNL